MRGGCFLRCFSFGQPFGLQILVGMGKVSTPAKPSLLPGRLVQQHLKSCKLKNCGLCHWAAKKDYWRAELKSPWLHVTLKNKAARLGCSICALQGTGGPWANFEQKPLTLKLHHFKRHEDSKTHQLAAEKQSSDDGSRFAPDLDSFKDSLKRMRAGGSQRDGGCCSDRKQQIRWCLAEACLDVGRETLRSALSIAITRDERKGRLLLRWRACTPKLSAASGVLGFLPVEGFADNLAHSLKTAVQHFSRPRSHLPRGFVDACPPPLDSQVERNIRASTYVLVTDAAAAELLASGQLSGRRPYVDTGICESYLTSVKNIGRDAPHATTRLLKRPFQASSDLQMLMNEFVTGQNSFAQKVFHSPLYQGWWKSLVAEDSGGPTSMAAAKHRFGSFLNPLSRISDNVSSMIKLCHKVAVVRGECGDWAGKLLTHFSGRKAALLGMATDAAATCCDLTRSLDSESADVSELASHVQQFANSVEALFMSEKVLTLPTFTKSLCDSLDTSPARLLYQGMAKEIRVSPEDKRYALRVMKAGFLVLSDFLNFKTF